MDKSDEAAADGEAPLPAGTPWTHEEAERARTQLVASIEAQARARFPTGERPSREALHALLDAILDLAAMVRSTERDDAAKVTGRSLMQILIDKAASWTMEGVGAVPAPHIFKVEKDPDGRPKYRRALPPSVWKIRSVDILSSAPSLQRGTTADMADKIRSLNDGSGQAPEELKPGAKPGRGANPKARRLSEVTLLGWIEYQKHLPHGRRQKVAVTTALIAQLCGSIGPEAIEGWRRLAKKALGPAMLADHLRKAKTAAQAGEPFPLGSKGWTLEAETDRWRKAKAGTAPNS